MISDIGGASLVTSAAITINYWYNEQTNADTTPLNQRRNEE